MTMLIEIGNAGRKIRISRRDDGSYVRTEWLADWASDETITPTEATAFLRGVLTDARRRDDLDRRRGLKYPFDGSGSAEWRADRIERAIAAIDA